MIEFLFSILIKKINNKESIAMPILSVYLPNDTGIKKSVLLHGTSQSFNDL